MKNLFKSPSKVILAEYDSPQTLLHAAEKMRDAGYQCFDCHSPFPIHGMDRAMGLKRSPLGYIVAVMGSLGMLGMIILTWWTSVKAYPLVISGKPLFSWQAYIPVIFAITVLMSAFGAFFGMLALNKLPRLFHPIFYSERFARVTDGSFFISVESDEPGYDENKIRSFLESIGGKNVEVVSGS